MHRRLILFSVVTVVTLAGYYLFGEKDPRITMPTNGAGIIVFGDSLVSGVGASPGNGFVAVMERELGQPIANAGFPGDTTVTAQLRYQNDVLDKNPRIVVILLGGNDFLARISRDRTIGNLRSMVEEAQAQGAGVVLVGVRKAIYSSDYKRIAQETGAVYVPNVLDETFGRQELMADPIHPNDAGYRVFANRILPAIKQLQ
jgi:acyl-CoA thioesterase I